MYHVHTLGQIHVHVCTCMYICVHVHTFTYMFILVHEFVNMYIHVCTMYRALCTDLQILASVHVVKIPDEYAEYHDAKKYVKPFAVCRIVQGSDFAYSAYVCTPHFADASGPVSGWQCQLATAAAALTGRLQVPSPSPGQYEPDPPATRSHPSQCPSPLAARASHGAASDPDRPGR